MDSIRAKHLEDELRGTQVAGWTIGDRLGNGKSAVVFAAEKDGLSAAIKIFDREFIERYGDKQQDARLAMERTMIGVTHPNIVQIYDAGVDAARDLRYVAMEYLDACTLEDTVLDPETPFIAPDQIPSVLTQIVDAARFLEQRNLVHRDIKPSNIAYLASGRVVLLDLGVLRVIGEPGETDNEGQRVFVGTLQYGSPEFVLREMEDTVEAWRAVTFYQIGAVLHDLIMQRPIFDGIAPYTRLEQAILHETPVVANRDVDQDLIALCKACLVKSPYTRLSVVTWDSFNVDELEASRAKSKERFLRRTALLQASREETRATEEQIAAKNELATKCRAIVAELLRSLTGTGTLPRAVIHVDGEVLRCEFDDLEKFELGRRLLMNIRVGILEVQSSAVVTTCEVEHSTLDGKSVAYSTEVFRGVLDAGQLFGSLESSLYAILDRAQSDSSPTLRRSE